MIIGSDRKLIGQSPDFIDDEASEILVDDRYSGKLDEVGFVLDIRISLMTRSVAVPPPVVSLSKELALG